MVRVNEGKSYIVVQVKIWYNLFIENTFRNYDCTNHSFCFMYIYNLTVTNLKRPVKEV